jgi:hypothetical protein
MLRIDIISIFPEVFEPVLGSSMLGIARDKGALALEVHDLRTWTSDKHRTTDDYPYGGGYGMVMKPEPFFAAVEAVKALDERPATLADRVLAEWAVSRGPGHFGYRSWSFETALLRELQRLGLAAPVFARAGN